MTKTDFVVFSFTVVHFKENATSNRYCMPSVDANLDLCTLHAQWFHFNYDKTILVTVFVNFGAIF